MVDIPSSVAIIGASRTECIVIGGFSCTNNWRQKVLPLSDDQPAGHLKQTVEFIVALRYCPTSHSIHAPLSPVPASPATHFKHLALKHSNALNQTTTQQMLRRICNKISGRSQSNDLTSPLLLHDDDNDGNIIRRTTIQLSKNASTSVCANANTICAHGISPSSTEICCNSNSTSASSASSSSFCGLIDYEHFESFFLPFSPWI